MSQDDQDPKIDPSLAVPIGGKKGPSQAVKNCNTGITFAAMRAIGEAQGRVDLVARQLVVTRAALASVLRRHGKHRINAKVIEEHLERLVVEPNAGGEAWDLTLSCKKKEGEVQIIH